MIKQKKIYPWIDVTKLICALLIVFMHSYCYDFEGGYGLKIHFRRLAFRSFSLHLAFSMKRDWKELQIGSNISFAI